MFAPPTTAAVKNQTDGDAQFSSFRVDIIVYRSPGLLSNEKRWRLKIFTKKGRLRNA